MTIDEAFRLLVTIVPPFIYLFCTVLLWITWKRRTEHLKFRLERAEEERDLYKQRLFSSHLVSTPLLPDINFNLLRVRYEDDPVILNLVDLLTRETEEEEP